MITRQQFIDSFALEYLYRHKDVTHSYAKRMARLRWRHMQKKADLDQDYAQYASVRYQFTDV